MVVVSGYNKTSTAMEPEQKKLKILFIITKSNFGGAQRYVYDLATHLPKDQFESVVALGGSGILKAKLEAAGIQTIILPDLERDISIVKEWRAFVNIFKVIKETRPDIVHLNSSKAGALGALAARFYNFFLKLSTKIIFTAHGWAFKEKRKSVSKKMIEYISWITVFLSHQTIVVSDDDREKARAFIFVQPKIVLIHNGIDKPIFKKKNEARGILSEKIGQMIGDETLLIGSIAELHKNKGLEYAVAALALIKRQQIGRETPADKITYVIVGEGEERENLEIAITREGLKDSILLAGEIPGAAQFLKAFDIFLLPSLKEGLPYVLLEAAWAGLPVVATNVGGVTEVIADMKSGIVVKEKRPKEIADALTFLIGNKAKRKEFGLSILETVETEYTLEHMLGETIALYKRLS